MTASIMKELKKTLLDIFAESLALVSFFSFSLLFAWQFLSKVFVIHIKYIKTF